MLIVVGERANNSGLAPYGSLVDLDQRIRENVFTNGPSRTFISKLDLRLWDVGFNLLPPVPTRHASWLAEDRAAARQVAEQAARRFAHHNPVYLLFGGRVQWAFRVKAAPFVYANFNFAGTWIAMPHPSPRNRAWNDEETWRKAQRAVALALNMSAERELS